MTSKKLYQLLYVSEVIKPLDHHELVDLVNVARLNNKQNDIRGLLLYNRRSFMQCIEGPSQNVHHLFNAIEEDARHTNVREIYCKSIVKYHFKDWRMGFRYFKRDFCQDDIFYSAISSLSTSISHNLSLPNMRLFMKDFYDEPRHDVFEGWLHA